MSEPKELCARHTPERDHHGVLCRACANEEVARLSQIIDEKIESVGELVIEQEQLRAALKKAKIYRRRTGTDERVVVSMVFDPDYNFEPISAFLGADDPLDKEWTPEEWEKLPPAPELVPKEEK